MARPRGTLILDVELRGADVWHRTLDSSPAVAAGAAGVKSAASRARGSSAAMVAHRYRDRMVLVQDLGTEPAVDVVSADGFLLVADQATDAVLHCIGQGCHVYQVELGGSRYRYTVRASQAPAGESVYSG